MDGTALTIFILFASIALILWGLYSLVKHAVKQALREFAAENAKESEKQL